MILRPFLAAGLLALALTVAACGGDEEAPLAEADLGDIGTRPATDQAAYLAAFRLGEQIKEQDSTFNVDVFLRGLRAGYETDSAEAFAYAFGYQRGLELQVQAREDSTLTPDLGVFAAGVREGFRGDSIRISPRDEMRVQEEMQLGQIRREAATNPNAQQFLDQIETNAAQADSFLTANRAQEGIQTTASGLQYRVLTPGTGESPVAGESVLMSYTLSLPDGTELQQSEEPIVFEIGEELIPGMIEALTMMRPGERRLVYIPPALGYGTLGEPRAGIGPNTVLVFDVTLEEVMDPVADPGAGTSAPATPPAPAPVE